ncbi:MAG: hypothetical protein J6D34_08200 [Atopobiaceae bacterium]|nr:hypothetical protein [Atopobiaceae bacterium]
MPIEKPLPLMVGNKAFYTLTSYGPVDITVDVPFTTDEDIEYGLQMTVADMGGTLDDLDNPDWVAEHFDGMTSKEQVVDEMRKQMAGMAAQIAENQKVVKCVEELSKRLAQSVPPQHLEQAKQAVKMRFAQQLENDGLTPEQFLMRSGTTPTQLEAMFDRQARQMAEGDAALSAYAHERKLKVDEQEYSRLLGIPAAELQNVISQACAAGQYDGLHEAALQAKAGQIVVAECNCTYNHETEEQAHARIAKYHQMEQMFAERFGDDAEADSEVEADGDNDKTGFKLV